MDRKKAISVLALIMAVVMILSLVITVIPGFAIEEEEIDELEEKHHFLGKIPSNVLLYYVRSTTPYLARAISENIVGDTPELRENMWQLISGGMSALWN